MRNKAKGFPNRISLNGEPRAKEEFTSQRPNGQIKERPRERMHSSNQVDHRKG
ncbi:MAG TPA: small, acid-soluble spore protein K [Bacillales bacterium]